MRTHLGEYKVEMFMAQDDRRTFTIQREDDDRWTLWCNVGAATLALASDPLNKLKFEAPEQCVALFRDASLVGDAWADFLDRIHAHDFLNAPATLDPSLGEERSWCGPVSCS